MGRYDAGQKIMEAHKRAFIEFMVRCEVLRFGDFVTKSGRRTPFFIDTGRYRTGAQLSRLGAAYARVIREHLGTGFDVLFGPAYKGIPLVAATAIRLQEDFGHDVGWCFDRKEVKDHGEGGSLVGHTLRDGERVVLIDDVTTAGTSVRKSVPLLRAAAEIELAGLVVSVDRRERGRGEAGALEELSLEFGMPAFAIVTLDEVIEHLRGREVGGRILLEGELLERVEAYREAYGAKGRPREPRSDT